MSRFDEIRKGLLEAIAYERGELPEKVSTRRMALAKVKDFTPAEIKQIRLNAEMTQTAFALCLGASQKSVEAWEGGRSKPNGSARRLLGLMEIDPKIMDKMGIYVR